MALGLGVFSYNLSLFDFSPEDHVYIRLVYYIEIVLSVTSFVLPWVCLQSSLFSVFADIYSVCQQIACVPPQQDWLYLVLLSVCQVGEPPVDMKDYFADSVGKFNRIFLSELLRLPDACIVCCCFSYALVFL